MTDEQLAFYLLGQAVFRAEKLARESAVLRAKLAEPAVPPSAQATPPCESA
jgi:hypothetical protein